MKTERKKTYELSDMSHVLIRAFSETALNSWYHLKEKLEYSMFLLFPVNVHEFVVGKSNVGDNYILVCKLLRWVVCQIPDPERPIGHKGADVA